METQAPGRSRPRRPFAALAFALGITLLFYILQNLTLKWTRAEGWGPDLSALVWCLPSVLGIALTFLLVRRDGPGGAREGMGLLGFKRLTLHQAGLGLALAVPVLVGYVEGYFSYRHKGFTVVLFPEWPFLLVWFLAGSLFEETVFRGHLFRSLREGWDFFPAALVSSLAWALAHFGNAFLASNVRYAFPEIVIFLLGLAGAYVFERSGNSIWPWMIVHVAVNAIGLVDIGGAGMFRAPIGAPIGYLFGGEFIALALAFPLARRFAQEEGRVR